MRLRVLHVTPYTDAAWAYGGIARLGGTIVRGLAARGHDVTVCATDVCTEHARLDKRRGFRRLRAWSPFTTNEGVTVRIFPNVSNRLAYEQLFLPLGFARFLERSASSFDVAHLHACRNVPATMAAFHLRRAGVPYIVAPNGTAPRIERRRLAKRVFDIVAGRRVLGGAARLIAVSDAERRQLVALGIQPDRIRVIPNPIDLTEFARPVARGRFRRRLGADPGPIVMFLGRITPRKRLDVLIRAFARLARPDAWLVVAGNDAGAVSAARRVASAFGVADRTLFTGLLRGRERLEALADADVVVYPSEDEVFGLVPLEALLAGTPVVVANDSGCGEVIEQTGGGQAVPVGDVDRLADAVDTVLDSPHFWRRRASEAADRARVAYAPDRICARLDDVYRELVAGA